MRIDLTLAAAIAAFALLATPPAMAQNPPQQQQQKGKPAARPHQPRQQHQPRVQRQQPRVQQHQQRVQQPKVQKQQRVQQQQRQQQRVQQRAQPQRNAVTRAAKPPRSVTFRANRPTVSVRARAWNNSGRYNYRGRNYSYWRHGPWRHRYNGGWRTYVALSTLAAIAYGANTYYPYAYLDVPENYCDGITEDGCQMSWTEVETVEGGVAPACVTYCPWQ
jgi:hypothetical protein